MRLQSFLSRSGVASRRNIVGEIEAGKVTVNGEVVRIPSYPIFPGKDEVQFEGRAVKLRTRLYFIFHKPKGVITTARDTHGRKTVLDFFKDVQDRIFPVGRLDADTTGLLLLTNDGDLTYRLTHPKFGVTKVYEAVLNRRVSTEDVKKVEQGVLLDDRPTAPCKIRILKGPHGKSRLEISLHEGRNRQIHRMFESVGCQIETLHRSRYGALNLHGLRPGQSRRLKDYELELLERSVSPEGPEDIHEQSKQGEQEWKEKKKWHKRRRFKHRRRS